MNPPSTPATGQAPLTVGVFVQRFSSIPRGARLARRLVLHQLAANAVTHGRVPGRDFEVTAKLLGRTLRIEVSDTRGELRPPAPGAPRPAMPPLAETYAPPAGGEMGLPAETAPVFPVVEA